MVPVTQIRVNKLDRMLNFSPVQVMYMWDNEKILEIKNYRSYKASNFVMTLKINFNS